MSALQDRELERLSELLARGTLNNAREIARLLRGELGPTRPAHARERELEVAFGTVWPGSPIGGEWNFALGLSASLPGRGASAARISTLMGRCSQPWMLQG
jgi:hypothetical protein